MGKPLQRVVRPIASMVMLVLVVVSSAECVLGTMSAEEMACCAAMKGDCDMAITSSCCAGNVDDQDVLAATKPAVDFAPATILLAILTAPPIPVPVRHQFASPETGSASPPGVSTYLFVSSFRI